MTLPDLDALIERLQRRPYGAMDDDQCRSQAAAALVQLREENARLDSIWDSTIAATWLRRAERAEAEVARLRGESQCFTCGGPATAHWCDLHRPTLLNGPAIAKETHDQAVLDRGAEQMRRLRGKACDCVRPEIHGHQLLCKHGKAR